MKRLTLLTLITFILFSCNKENATNPAKNLSVTVSGTPTFTMEISTSPDSVNYTTLIDTTISSDTSYTYRFHANAGSYLRVIAYDLPKAYLGFEVIYNNTIMNYQPTYLNYGIIEMTYNHRIGN